MPRPTRAQMEADLQGLTPAQQTQYMDQVEAQFPPETVNDTGPFLSPQPERGAGDTIRNWLAGLASERRILEGERQEIGSIARDPGWLDLAKVGLAGAAAGMPGQIISAPVRSGLGLLSGILGGSIGGKLGETAGEKIAPGVGTLGREAGETVGGALGGIAPEAAVASLAKFSPTLREGALRSYAKLLGPQTDRESIRFAERLAPAAEEIPWVNPVNPRKALERVGEAKAKPAGEAVGALYNVETPSSFEPSIQQVRALASKQEQRSAPAHERYTVGDDGEVQSEFVPAAIKNAPFYKALQQRVGELKIKQARAESAAEAGVSKGVTIRDIFEARKAADELAMQAKAKVFSPKTSEREMAPRPKALKAERSALQKTLHTEVPGGKEADALFSAWKSVQSAGQERDPGTFLFRWFAGRTIPGVGGTAAGYFAAQPAFWNVTSGNVKRAMARALDEGQLGKLNSLLRAATSTYVANREENKP